MAREKGGPHYVWGICTNLDKDGNGTPCTNCKSKEKIKLSLRDEFVCPECGEPLTKVKGPDGPNWKLIGIIIAAVLVLAGIGFGVYKLLGDSKVTAIKLDKKKLTMKVGERDLLTATVEPEGAKATFIWKSSDKNVVDVVGGELTALKAGEATISVKVEENPELRAVSCKIKVKENTVIDDSTKLPGGNPPVEITNLSISSADFTLKAGETKQLGYEATPAKNDETISWSTSDPKVATVSEDGLVKAVGAGTATITILSDKSAKEASVKVTVSTKDNQPKPKSSGTLNLGYGSYRGDIKNGKPHGYGTITYKSSHKIVSWKEHVASPGDTFEGDFRDGQIVNGYWNRKSDGNKIFIN